MTLGAHPAVRPRRLFVSGGSVLSPAAFSLWEALGRELANERGLVVITGGLRAVQDKAGSNPADWAVVCGMKQVLDHEELARSAETVLPDEARDYSKLVRFHEGTVIRVRNRTSQSRRFSMANSADVVVSIAGESGTRAVLDMALAIERPILPIPVADGVSARRWKENRADIQQWFKITDAEADELERLDLERADIDELAGRIRRWLMNGFTRSCFVIMPFGGHDALYDDAIRPALEARRLRPVRLDRVGLPGDAIDAIHRGLASCYLAVAVVTGARPNVMYELGIAHALEKPVVLLCEVTGDNDVELPFDLSSKHCIGYGEDLDTLRDVLHRTLGVVLRESESLDVV